MCAGDARQRETGCASADADAKDETGDDEGRARAGGEGGHARDEGTMITFFTFFGFGVVIAGVHGCLVRLKRIEIDVQDCLVKLNRRSG